MKLLSTLAILVSLLMLYIGYDLIGSNWSNERAIGGTLMYMWLVPFVGGLIGLVKGLRT
ncbi:TRAP-type C4-dicarboxylate transport system permease small subunit [Variovorax boronicumulans]|uniref:hypothetical protein n=1 Tax=Variovorax boronicumulans TaxID=436515 RepID=UPI002475E570|nr:hypothetical protein [Variovorax boronicumulans]MDH6166081.1 TRAP-type C4-dicarboxylate transport system permease small subunit [Variovorax boronicumulans]